MKHLDLFSGIGGFAYAAQQVWGDEYENAGFVEIDPFCRAILTKNFPQAKIYGDIRTVTNPDSAGLQGGEHQEGSDAGRAEPSANPDDARRQRLDVLQQGRPGGGRSDRGVDLITGGFPCQPFSAAGKRRGTSDDRYLWPEMLRIIREFSPSWVIAENVGGLVTWSGGLVFETVCADLETSGYEVQPFVIPAAAVGAPHRRDRIWFVANAGRLRGDARRPTPIRPKGQEPEQPYGKRADWNRDWQEVAFATCLPRMDDGLPPRLVRLPDGTTISEARWRKEALKAYGNAIVPQVAMEIMKAIKEVDDKQKVLGAETL